MAMDLKEIEKYIKEAMPDAIIEIQDLAGDGNHYSATVTSTQFVGKTKIQQHKMVYDSLKGKMGNELHALALKTNPTPAYSLACPFCSFSEQCALVRH